MKFVSMMMMMMMMMLSSASAQAATYTGDGTIQYYTGESSSVDLSIDKHLHPVETDVVKLEFSWKEGVPKKDQAVTIIDTHATVHYSGWNCQGTGSAMTCDITYYENSSKVYTGTVSSLSTGTSFDATIHCSSSGACVLDEFGLAPLADSSAAWYPFTEISCYSFPGHPSFRIWSRSNTCAGFPEDDVDPFGNPVVHPSGWENRCSVTGAASVDMSSAWTDTCVDDAVDYL